MLYSDLYTTLRDILFELLLLYLNIFGNILLIKYGILQMIFIVFLIAIIILLIIIIRDYRHLHRINPTTDILFATSPEKKQLDLMISDGFPIVIIDKIQDSVSLKDLSEKLPNLQITYNYKTKDTTNTIEMKDLHSHLDDFLLLKNESIVENLKLK